LIAHEQPEAVKGPVLGLLRDPSFTECTLLYPGVFCPRTLTRLYRTAPGVLCFTLGLDEDEEVDDLDTSSAPCDDATPWPLEQLEPSGSLAQVFNACVAMCDFHGSIVRLGLDEDTEDGSTADILAGIDHPQVTSLEVNAYTSDVILMKFMGAYGAVKERCLDYHCKPKHLHKLPPHICRLQSKPATR
jgi:hypothetical protein